MRKPNFSYLALPFSIVNGVVWSTGIASLPLLAKTTSRAGLTFAMINLDILFSGIAILLSILQSKIKT